MYQERAASRIAGAVVWERTASGRPTRILPDGCMDVIMDGGALLVAGPDTRAHMAEAPAGTRGTGLRFAPGMAPAVLGVPADELRDQRVPLDALWPQARVRLIAERLAEAADPGAVLEALAVDRLRTAEPPSPFPASAVADALARGHTVADVALAVGYGERQLHRRCLAAFGYGPKTLARVLRMRRALELARRAVPFAEVAVVAGYADQAHLAREVRALAGVPLGELIR